MKQYAQQARIKLVTLIMASVAGAGVAATVPAAGIGTGTSVHAGAGTSASIPDTAPTSGSAEAHMSTVGSANSNAQWMSGATRAAGRATERMDAHGADKEATGTASAWNKR